MKSFLRLFALTCLFCCILLFSCADGVDDDSSLNNEETVNLSDIESVNATLVQNGINSLNLTFTYDEEKDILSSNIQSIKLELNLSDYTVNDSGFIVFSYVLQNNNGEKKSGTAKYTLLDEAINDFGILLSFDDYFPGNWEKYLSLFTENNATCTWFCYGKLSRFQSFALTAQEQGFEVGYHTKSHKSWKSVTEDYVYEQAVEPLLDFYTNDIYLKSFAFMGGTYSQWMIPYLLKYYKILRGFYNKPTYYKKSQIQSERFILSNAIDWQWFSDDEDFINTMEKRLIISKVCHYVYPCTSHYIRDDSVDEHYYNNDGEIYDTYTITASRLRALCEKANELKVPFLLYKDLY